MYDGKTQLLIENPINRYLINSPMLPSLKNNPDGSLTIYIQKDAPSADKKANWLPAPNGPIYMVMRLYWPRVAPPPSILPLVMERGNHLECWSHDRTRYNPARLSTRSLRGLSPEFLFAVSETAPAHVGAQTRV